MSEPIKSPQNNNHQPPTPQAQPSAQLESGVRVVQTRNSNSLLRNFVYLLSLMGLVSLLFWLVIPTNPPATLAQVTPVATAGGWEVPITQTVVPKVTPTPTPMSMIVTIYPTPTEVPTRTPTPTTPANSDGSATVGGYTFSPPHAVKIEDLKDVVVQGWLSDDTVVDLSNQQVLAINVQTGDIKPLSPKFAEDMYPPVFRFMRNRQVVFYETSNLWLTGLDEVASAPIPRGSVRGLLIVGPDGQEIWFYHVKNQQLNVMGLDRQIKPGDEKFIPAFTMPPKHEPEETENLSFISDTNYVSGWTALKTYTYMRLVNLHSGEFKDIDMWPDYIRVAYWSPDGQKMALLVTETPLGSSYMNLFVVDVATGGIEEIKTEFAYITNVTWSPDSENLLFSANTGVKIVSDQDKYNTVTLFLVNLASPDKIWPVPILPQDAYMSFVGQLFWSPDGKAIALSATIPGNLSLLHRIDVTKP